MRLFPALVLGAIAIGAAPAFAGDQFIILGIEETQAAAQSAAATSGAWVLDTDLYPKLPPNRYAVVHGPFVTAFAARAELAVLKGAGEVGASVRDAGECRLAVGLGDGRVPASVFTALLGELTVEVEDRPGSTSPCEPQEAYQKVEVRVTALGPAGGDKAAPLQAVPQVLPLGGFFVIKRTGEVQRLRICVE
jgi:hypothetical protein